MNPLNSNQKPDFGQFCSQVMKNPNAFLSKIGIPQNITSPQGAVQYLLQSGKITQSQIDKAQQMAEQIQRKSI